MSSGTDYFAGEVTDLDNAPLTKLGGQGPEEDAVGGFDVLEGLVGENDAKSVGIARSIPLVQVNSQVGGVLLEEDRQVEPGRSTSHDRYLLRSAQKSDLDLTMPLFTSIA
jgi:hypothetical protein